MWLQLNICGVKSFAEFAVNELVFVHTGPHLLEVLTPKNLPVVDRDQSCETSSSGFSLCSEWPQLQRSLQAHRTTVSAAGALTSSNQFHRKALKTPHLLKHEDSLVVGVIFTSVLPPSAAFKPKEQAILSQDTCVCCSIADTSLTIKYLCSLFT